jgi:hypothetical protein
MCINEIKGNPALNVAADMAIYGGAKALPNNKFLHNLVHMHTEAYLELQ